MEESLFIEDRTGAELDNNGRVIEPTTSEQSSDVVVSKKKQANKKSKRNAKVTRRKEKESNKAKSSKSPKSPRHAKAGATELENQNDSTNKLAKNPHDLTPQQRLVNAKRKATKDIVVEKSGGLVVKQPNASPADHIGKEGDLEGSSLTASELREDSSDSENSAPEEVTTRPKRGKSAKPKAPKRVWVDEDDQNDINLLDVPRRKKLRKSEKDILLSGEAYTDRVRNFLADQASSRGALGNWADIPEDGPIIVGPASVKPKNQKSQQKENSDSDSDGDDLEDDADDDNLLSAEVRELMRTNGLGRRHREVGGALPAGIIRVRQAPHANGADPSKCEASCVEFHPSGRLLMTAGLDKTVRMFSIDGAENPRVQAIHFDNFPIRSACFLRGGDTAIFGGRRRFLQALDFESGAVTTVRSLGDREDRSWEHATADASGRRVAFAGIRGKVVLMSADSLRETGQLRVNGRVGAMAFGPSQHEHEMLTASEDGIIQLWDVRTMACVDRHTDEGSVHTSCLTMSGAHYATGSDSGVVNVYDCEALKRANDESATAKDSIQHYGLVSAARMGVPIKRLFNLRTPIHNAKFSPDGQVLAFASHDKKGAVRLAHTGTMTVFRNWPSDRARVRRVCSLAFSPGGGYLAIGNDNGIVQMLRLLAYPAC